MVDAPSVATLHFQDYRLLRAIDMELGSLNVIIGRNGIGKSTTLDGLHQLLQLLGPNSAANVFSGNHDPRQLLSRPDGTTLQVGASFSDGQTFAVRISAIGEQRKGRLEMFCGRVGAEAALLRPDQQPDAALRQINSVLIRLEANVLAEAHSSEREIPQIDPDGRGLAAVLQYMQGLRDGSLDAVEDDLRTLVPGTGRIRVLPTVINLGGRAGSVAGARFELERGGIGWLGAEQLSRGTLLALGLVTALHWRPPRMLLLDDIDQGLHPVAQRRFITALRRFLERHPQSQIVAVSHSPFVLDMLAGHEVLVAGATSPFSTRLTRLDRHLAWAQRAHYLHPGELWAAIGEDWVTETQR